jgi:hypothetical protein
MDPLPLGGFRLVIDGEWHAFNSSNQQRNIRIEFKGIWPLSLPKPTYSAEISGSVLVEDVADSAPMAGRLSVTLLPPGFALAVEFTDSQGDRYIINYKAQSMIRPPFGKTTPAEGALLKGAIEIGEVCLYMDFQHVLHVLPSLA